MPTSFAQKKSTPLITQHTHRAPYILGLWHYSGRSSSLICEILCSGIPDGVLIWDGQPPLPPFIPASAEQPSFGPSFPTLLCCHRPKWSLQSADKGRSKQLRPTFSTSVHEEDTGAHTCRNRHFDRRLHIDTNTETRSYAQREKHQLRTIQKCWCKKKHGERRRNTKSDSHNIETDKQTDWQTDRQTDRHTDRQTDRQANKQTHKHKDRQTDGQTDTVRQTDTQIGKKTGKHTDP